MKDRAIHSSGKVQHSIDSHTRVCTGSNWSYTNAQLLLKIALANFGRLDGCADSADALAVKFNDAPTVKINRLERFKNS